MADPSIEDIRVLLRELPTVVAKPLSKGSATNLP
jgi:hypothetical protein